MYQETSGPATNGTSERNRRPLKIQPSAPEAMSEAKRIGPTKLCGLKPGPPPRGKPGPPKLIWICDAPVCFCVLTSLRFGDTEIEPIPGLVPNEACKPSTTAIRENMRQAALIARKQSGSDQDGRRKQKPMNFLSDDEKMLVVARIGSDRPGFRSVGG